MSSVREYAEIVASSLDWEQAHASFDRCLEGLPPELRGKRADNLPHSVWELVDHIRIAQHDLLDFCANPKYSHDIEWPGDYWPKAPAPKNDKEWTDCLDMLHADVAAMKKFTVDNAEKLAEKIPWGTGQTFLRTVLVAMDHVSHHTGQIIFVRRALGSWPPPKK
jgi:uncharacterized damage-inducible protein DinB